MKKKIPHRAKTAQGFLGARHRSGVCIHLNHNSAQSDLFTPIIPFYDTEVLRG